MRLDLRGYRMIHDESDCNGKCPVHCAIYQRDKEIRKLEKEADATYRDAISTMFRDPKIDARVLFREKEILENLENAVDQWMP